MVTPSNTEPRGLPHLDAVAIFVEVVRAKSFSEAARRLGMPKSTVSVRVAELETRLGVSLLHRTTRRVQPTAAGQTFFAAAARTLVDLRTAEIEATQAQADPSGSLRVTSAGTAIGNVGERIAEFMRLYPKIRVELLLTDERLDLLAEGIDVAFRIGPTGDEPNLTARAIGSAEQALFASPAYLRQHKAPTHPRELSQHLLLLPPARRELALVGANGVRFSARQSPRFLAAHPVALRQQALRDHGIALLPRPLGEEDVNSGALRRVLPEWTTAPMPVSLVYATGPYLPHRVRLFVDFVFAASRKGHAPRVHRSRS